MNELKNCLVLKSQTPVTRERGEQIRECLEPLLESTNSELIICGPDEDVTFHPTASMDRLCDSIDRLVEINQAMLAYLVDLEGVDQPEGDQSLDG